MLRYAICALFFEVLELGEAITTIVRDRIVASEMSGADGGHPWAVLHDPEGHNIVLLESGQRRR